VTDILASIDDTLADWHGSADSMRWRPDGDVDDEPAESLDSLMRLFAAPPLLPHHDSQLDLTPAPLLEPGMVIRITSGVDSQLLRVVRELDDGRWQVRPTTLARPLDARYRQRQRNRRKRK
jgi:hypothetical protein